MIVNALSPFILWIVSQAPVATHEQLPCLAYYGSTAAAKRFFYGTADPNCAELVQGLWPKERALKLERNDRTQLIWLERDLDALDPSLRDSSSSASALQWPQAGYEQHVLHSGIRAAEVLQADQDTALLVMDRSLAVSVDDHLAPFWKAIRIPEEPLAVVPVPPASVERVRQLLDTVKYDPVVESLVETLSIPKMKDDIRYLTGEDPESPIVSRHSFSDGVLVAAQWLKDRFEETGASCALKTFRPGYAPNVIWYVGLANDCVT